MTAPDQPPASPAATGSNRQDDLRDRIEAALRNRVHQGPQRPLPDGPGAVLGATMGDLADAVLDVVEAEIDQAVRGVQAWMALDLHLALGRDADMSADVQHQGHPSWADWWAVLIHQVKQMRTTPAVQRAEAAEAENARLRATYGHLAEQHQQIGDLP